MTEAGYPRAPLSGPELGDLRTRATLFEGFGAIWANSAALTGDGEPQRLRVGFVTTDFFTVLGAGAALGRTFAAEDEAKGAPPAILLSAALWQRRFGGDPGIVGRRVVVNGHDATDELRTETCGAAASAIAVIPSVRAALVDKQLSFRKAPGLVADGRDMGTVIFPDARFKVFLTASAEERAKRRYKQLKEKGLSVTLAALLREIQARDVRDAGRAVAPLRPAADAVLIDSTGMPIEAVVATVLALVRPR